MKEVSDSFYINFRNILKNKGIKLSQLSMITGIHQTVLYTYWTNDKLPTIEHLELIADGLCVLVDDLIPASIRHALYPESKPKAEIETAGVDVPVLKNFDLHKFIDECITKKDRSVSIYFNPNGVSISVYPYDMSEED